MFTTLLMMARAKGLPIGLREWLTLLSMLSAGQIVDLGRLHRLGRAVLCRTEADFDAWDVAFAETFEGVGVPEDLKERLEAWLRDARSTEEALVASPFDTDDELWREFLQRMNEQSEAHHGGSRWIGTGGRSPFGHSGNAATGIRVGGAGRNRGAIAVAGERAWRGYRTDRTLQTRDLSVALKALRKLHREGRSELDLDGTIDATAKNAGDLELVERPERQNRIRVVLVMDSGGSMDPHTERVEALFTAASQARHLRSLETWLFHNCPYSRLQPSDGGAMVPTTEVLAQLTPQHRLVFVGDASMAPYELFSASGWGLGHEGQMTGIDWLRRFRARCPSAVWLNPDPRRWWDHPTVRAIGGLFEMHELTIDGLRDAIRTLRRAV